MGEVVLKGYTVPLPLTPLLPSSVPVPALLKGMNMATTTGELLDRSKIVTPWSGAVRMADGVDYHGNVYRLVRSAYVYVLYRNEPVEVRWDEATSAYVRHE